MDHDCCRLVLHRSRIHQFGWLVLRGPRRQSIGRTRATSSVDWSCVDHDGNRLVLRGPRGYLCGAPDLQESQLHLFCRLVLRGPRRQTSGPPRATRLPSGRARPAFASNVVFSLRMDHGRCRLVPRESRLRLLCRLVLRGPRRQTSGPARAARLPSRRARPACASNVVFLLQATSMSPEGCRARIFPQ